MTTIMEKTEVGYTMAIGTSSSHLSIYSVGSVLVSTSITSEDPRQEGRDRLAELRGRAQRRTRSAGGALHHADVETSAEVVELRASQFRTQSWLED